MTVAVYVVIFAGLLIFVAGCLLRIYQYARTPLHLRWELYPVPHEEPSRVAHGGSYFESGQWWLSPQAVHHRAEWMTMLREIVFLKGLREYNPRLWLSSFLFHFGLYLAIVTIAMATAAALPAVLIPGITTARLWTVVALLCRWTGAAGILLVLIGAVALLVRRITDPSLKNYTRPADIFNLLFFIAAFVLVAVGYLMRAPGAASLGEIARGIVHFDLSVRISATLGIGLVLASALTAYIPFTHMSHFIAKYFTWHAVRWDDRRNTRGSTIEARVSAYLNYKPTWAAPHLGADGKKTWAEIATSQPTQEAKK